MRRGAFWICLCLAAAMAADGDRAGRYAGEWKSEASGNGGAIHFTLSGGSGSAWKCDLMFTLDGADVKTTMRDVKVQDTKVDFTYDFDVQGTIVQSHVTGEWNGTAFRGKYQSGLPDGSQTVDAGTWSAERAK